jgi:general secretion pathway protein I
MRSSKSSKAFTLLEVLVALAIVSIALAAMAGKMVQMVNGASTMRDRTYASWIGHNKITEMRLANVVPDVSASSGEVDYAGVEWAWRAVVSETGVENLYRVDVTISFPGGEPLMRPISGFIGEPIRPGLSNGTWVSGASRQGGQSDGQDQQTGGPRE